MLLNIWCVLRSLSTAFEKLVESRGDFYVYGEPFADAYLKAKGIMAKDNGDELSFKSISRMLLEKSKGNNVFVKEMAHHVVTMSMMSFLKEA
jgi:hypothetical protein